MDDVLVYDGWLKVLKRRVKGREYDILKDYDAVSAIVVNEFDEILMVKQYRPAAMGETLEIPAGTLDINGENEVDCLIRELYEETGLCIDPGSVVPTFSYKPMLGFSNSLMRTYFISVKRQDLKNRRIDDEDVYEVLWMGLEDLKDKIAKGEILDVKAIIAYFYLNSSRI